MTCRASLSSLQSRHCSADICAAKSWSTNLHAYGTQAHKLVCLQDVMRFLCSPSAGDLRRLLVRELVNGLDLLLRDRLRRAFNSLPSMLAPRLPLFGPLPMPPAGPLLGLLPVFVPGLGFKSAQDMLALVAPTLDQGEEVHLQSLIELVTGLAGALRLCLAKQTAKQASCVACCKVCIIHAGTSYFRALV